MKQILYPPIHLKDIVINQILVTPHNKTLYEQLKKFKPPQNDPWPASIDISELKGNFSLWPSGSKFTLTRKQESVSEACFMTTTDFHRTLLAVISYNIGSVNDVF